MYDLFGLNGSFSKNSPWLYVQYYGTVTEIIYSTGSRSRKISSDYFLPPLQLAKTGPWAKFDHFLRTILFY